MEGTRAVIMRGNSPQEPAHATGVSVEARSPGRGRNFSPEFPTSGVLFAPRRAVPIVILRNYGDYAKRRSMPR